MANKDYHEIMTEITSQLTGDVKEDTKYLMAKCEEYKTHEMAKEILRGIGRLMYDIIPEDKREEINQAINNDNLGWKAALDEANYCIYKKDYYKAREILESLISKLESADMYSDDEITVYKDFSETFEDVLYLHRCRSEKNEKILKGAGYPYATIYTQYGGLLFELGEHQKAIDALKKARKWNPINADIAFELAENYKATGDLETFLKITQEAYAGCFRERTLARYYRNLAFYYSEKKKYREATACIKVYGKGKNGRGGKYYLYSSGDEHSVLIPLRKDIMLINHTHPKGTPYASDKDMRLMSYLKQLGSPQKTSTIYPVGKKPVKYDRKRRKK